MLKKLRDAKRIMIIGDIHYGCHSDSMEWLEIVNGFFEEFLFPTIQVEKPDAILFLGDLYEHRQRLNVLVAHQSKNTLYDLCEVTKDIPKVLILGNHDVYYKSSNTVNSPELVLESLPNFELYVEPDIVTIGGEKCLLMPWRKDHVADRECIEAFAKHKPKYLFCHTDFNGVAMNKTTIKHGGNDIDIVGDYERVFTGHIHYTQRLANINVVGTPYEITRSDSYNKKGVWMFDMDTKEERFIENTVSPRYFRYQYERIQEYGHDKIMEMFNNNFIDLYYKDDIENKRQVRRFLQKYSNVPRKLETILYIEDEVEFKHDGTPIESMSTLDICNTFVQKYVDVDEDTKHKLKNDIHRLYKEIKTI